MFQTLIISNIGSYRSNDVNYLPLRVITRVEPLCLVSSSHRWRSEFRCTVNRTDRIPPGLYRDRRDNIHLHLRWLDRSRRYNHLKAHNGISFVALTLNQIYPQASHDHHEIKRIFQMRSHSARNPASAVLVLAFGPAGSEAPTRDPETREE